MLLRSLCPRNGRFQPGDALKMKLDGEGFIVGDYVNYGARQLLDKEPLTRPGGVAGKRLRVIQSPLHATLWESFGAVPVGLSITETYNALATGVVDGMDLTKSAYAGFKLYEVVPDVIETGQIWASGALVFCHALLEQPYGRGATGLLGCRPTGCVIFQRTDRCR